MTSLYDVRLPAGKSVDSVEQLRDTDDESIKETQNSIHAKWDDVRVEED
jgi:hypothetical protein